MDALIAGQRDGRVLAELALGRLRKKIPALAETLVGHFDDHHAFLASMICDHIDTLNRMIAELSARIDAEIQPYRAEVAILDSIPGVDTHTAEVIIAEIGTDMTRFATAAHLASCAGVCPGNNKTAGKTNRPTPGQATDGSKPHLARPRWARSGARTPMPMPCSDAWRSAGAANGPKPPSPTALLVATWHILNGHTRYQDLGGDYFLTRDNPDHRRRRALSQLERLGYRVTLEPTAA